MTTKFDDKGFPYVTTIAPNAGALSDASATGDGFMFPSAVPANEAASRGMYSHLAVGLGLMAALAAL